VHKKTPKFHVGIDLGTTHTVVAFAEIDQQHAIQIFQIEQLIALGQVAARPLLPSVRYHLAENELPETEIMYSQSGFRAVMGEAARLLGAKSKGRLVTSAKSWLSHPSVDHYAAILPWGSPDEVGKVSPVDASASYLTHIRTVWNHQNPDAQLENQDIVITVPASFDETARSLTLEAANRAGLSHVRLLEEPQAVCYDWLRRNSGNIHNVLKNVHLLLICDIGGGTTDLSLIKIEHVQPEPKLTRIAVGDHIMLGGDNIDLALAHLAESRLHSDQSQLSAADFSQLIEQCREAKECLLGENAPEKVTITLLGSGSKLIGGARSTYITQEEVRQIALDGFFPLTHLDVLPDKKRSGVVEFGLPYTAEPAVSKHIAAFLSLHKDAAMAALQATSTVPDAILLNGGLFRSQKITQRILALFNSWNTNKPIILLENNHPELSVAYGAVSYAVARQNKQLKIGGGAARSYFLLVDTNDDPQMPSSQVHRQFGICVLPKGSEEGTEIILRDRQFALRTGKPVRFDLVSHSGDKAFEPGEMTEINDTFHALPPLAATFEDENTKQETEVLVQLGVAQTDIGTLKIQCISADETTIPDVAINHNHRQRWDVEFQIRNQGNIKSPANTALSPQYLAACEKIQAVFGPKSKQVDPNSVKNLRADLEKLLGRDRTEWDSSLLRILFTTLWEGHKFRRRSEHHERVWLSLAGFCLRPGFGCPLDDWRIEQLWQLYPQGLQFSNEIQNWSEWWTLWRRIAGGLDSAAQELIFSGLANHINPAASRQPNIAKQSKQRSYDDMVKLAAVLERLSSANKTQIGEWLIKRLEKASEPKQTWWALGRVGARIPFYGSSHTVIPAETANKWLTILLSQDWKNNLQIAFAATLISRKSGDRARDIDETIRSQIINKLKISKMPYPWLDLVENYKELDVKEENHFFGEALPPGLKLIKTMP
jgi:molecular chaperone DnaK (HSP70)